MDINSEGLPGTYVSQETVSDGWCDAEPIFTNGTVSHMMLLNHKSDFAAVRPIADDGALGEAEYAEEWTSGWEDLEMFYAGNTTYILRHKRWPSITLAGGVEVVPFQSEQGFTLISKVQRESPFADGTLGEQVYENTWGAGWTVIKFFYVGNRSFLLRYKGGDGTSEIYEINQQNPFVNNTVGMRVYSAGWSRGWNIVRFFRMNERIYCFLLKTETGRVNIYEMTAAGRLGALKYDGDWRAGWDNVNIFNHSDGNTYFLTLKSSTGEMNYHRFKTGDPFSARTPYEVISSRTWSKGWTHTKIYHSPSGYKLLLMKQ
jgi:hypothetical protein